MKNRKLTNTEIEALELYLHDNLPHGSGIDAGWCIGLDTLDKKGYLRCDNSYHTINQQGVYTGWKEFQFKLNPLTMEWTVKSTSTNDLREYLSDVFGNWLSENKQAIADILGVTLIPQEDKKHIFQALNSWRTQMLSQYGSPPNWPDWLKELSQRTNDLTRYTDNMGAI